MKLVVKKVFCSHCKKLIKGIEQATDGDIRVSCPDCKTPLWLWDGITWRHLKQA